jgi:hypothetical protein
MSNTVPGMGETMRCSSRSPLLSRPGAEVWIHCHC